MMWSVESSLKIVQPFLDLIFEVCHIVFGLWPQCRHMEYDIGNSTFITSMYLYMFIYLLLITVRGWLKREEKRQYRVGQFWYLISRDWWLTWMNYTQSVSTPPCEFCRKTHSQRNSNSGGIDEALVCDESFNSSSIDSANEAVHATSATSINNPDTCSIGMNQFFV